MNILYRLLLGAIIALVGSCSTLPPANPGTDSSQPTPLLLVSIDGYRHDYLDRGLSPTLARLANGGVRAVSLQPSFPSLTFPNHYTIVTGLRPDHHGVVNNTMFDPKLGEFSLGNRKAVGDGRWWAQGMPIWETAGQHGLRTATMFWPGSEADIHGRHPDYWLAFDGKITPDQRVDKVLAWLDLPAEKRPSFLTLYFDEVDHAGHRHGPDSSEVDTALRDTDEALARLVRGLEQRGLFERINLIVLSDHGMAAAPETNNVMLDELVPLEKVHVVSMGILAGFNPRSTTAVAKADFAQFANTLEQPQKHMECWDKTRVPARFGYGSNPRVPQLLCLAQVGWRISTTDYVASRKGQLPLGDHGYDNADPSMQALFIAHGPAFRVGATVPAFPNVDVYPLMTHLLGIPAAANDGEYDAVKDMLKPAAR